ncbi:hypothetical protein FA13DRAFT_1795344 [Coprinellus micaceus]|uniref:Uncharacterized protein n=1 Tax=Coprinellus micaceus TaxID=71717 RepID=A0A4Y7SW44_COPMI|nr:hypothetical protein FA13DRAFT_1806098 [Coprinellus micaceus]TEB25449.1 hypothetical protein FA13DRAFT_1796355 [Coprinellus micaceus]TEB26888.1 hypothetical protein FA13DRAFT_1795344 [Coprinellus micaceus]
MSVVHTRKDDPRSASLEEPYALPRSWFLETGDGLATSGMFLGGLIMVTRNRFLAWPSVVFGINSLINQHPLRQKESAAGWSNTGLCIVALFASYFPYFVVTKNPIV